MQVFDSHIDAGQALAAKDKQAYYTALLEYLAYGREPELGGAAAAVFVAIRPVLDQTRARSEGGKKGMRNRWGGDNSPDNSSGHVRGETPITKGKGKGKGKKETSPNGEVKKARAFAPPTVEEVCAYVSEKGYTFDPEAFVAHYAARGWCYGRGQPMKDWKAACVTWQKREEPAKGEEEEHGWWDAYDVR